MFICDCCGLCCMNLRMSSFYGDLDRGDGVCKYLDFDTGLCLVYENRPEKCNVDKMYELYYRGLMEKEQYYQLNYSVCRTLKEMGKVDYPVK